MPTYQYACTECGHAHEQFQSFNDDALTVCPACEGRLRKVFNAVGVVFKGSGFYRTDSRAGSGNGGAEDGTPKKAETSTGASTPAGDSAGTPATTKAADGSSNGSGKGSGKGSSAPAPAKTAGSKDSSAA